MRIALFAEVFLPKIDGIPNRLRPTIECLKEEGHEAAAGAGRLLAQYALQGRKTAEECTGPAETRRLLEDYAAARAAHRRRSLPGRLRHALAA